METGPAEKMLGVNVVAKWPQPGHELIMFRGGLGGKEKTKREAKKNNASVGITQWGGKGSEHNTGAE